MLVIGQHLTVLGWSQVLVTCLLAYRRSSLVVILKAFLICFVSVFH